MRSMSIRMTTWRGFALLACIALPTQPAFAASKTATADQPDFRTALREQISILSSVTSDAEALGVFSTVLGPTLGLTDTVVLLNKRPTAQKGASVSTAASDPTIVSEMTEQAIRLTLELAAWRLAGNLQATADAGEAAAIKTLLTETDQQRAWLLANPGHQPLRRAVQLLALAESLTSSLQTEETLSLHDDSSNYAAHAARLDHAYPRLTGADESWLSVGEREGPDGIRRRLMETGDNVAAQSKEKEMFAARYFTTRLRPVFLAQVVALAVRAEAESERQARDAWSRLYTWRDRLQEMKGLARLCGTWNWTIHNHQNHQDHKMVMAFPPPGASTSQPASNQPSSSGPGPAKIVVLGDGVYLRWEFQGGYQEDSLLFTGEGQRLEGTFINSAGAWGSIAGKRVAPCPR